jgi:serine/threonine protein kinase
MSEVLKKFGRYFLLDMIAQGGMAEIYRARLANAGGEGRLLVIKRIQAGFGANSEFLEMFKSEIKVTQRFTHPNIVQVYDYGEESQQPYIAMEWVDGRNLRQFTTRFNELKQSFPVDLAALIIEQAASALHYAHTFKDRVTGEPLNIVHRDISPQNVLISYEGVVKVIDFGIAKAATNSESTRAGVIKGKISYLSPEQINGEQLDGRSDIFALGIVMWELLTGKKLFSGESDLAVLKLIENCNSHVKPPSTLNPKVPKELDHIVLKALAKQREKRFQSGEELQRTLHKFLYSFNPDFNPGDLAYYARDLFKNEIVDDRKKIQKLNDKVEQLLTADVAPGPVAGFELESAPQEMSSVQAPPPKPTPPPPKREDTTTVVESRAKSTGSREIDGTSTHSAQRVEIEAPRPGSRPRQTGSIGGPGISSAPARHMPPSQQQSRGAATQTGKSAQRPTQTRSFSFAGLIRSAAGIAAATLAVAYFGPQYGLEIPVVSAMIQDFISGGDAQLVLDGQAKNVTVSVNGKAIANALPATIRGIPVGTRFNVTVTGAGSTFSQDFTLKKGEKRVVPVLMGDPDRTISGEAQAMAHDPNVLNIQSTTGAVQAEQPSGRTIRLRLMISPSGGSGSITLNGQPVDFLNPVTVVPLDVPLELQVERSGYHPLRREFVIDSRQVGSMTEWQTDVALEPSRFGFLSLRTTPTADAVIVIDGAKWVKKTPLNNEKLPVGNYTVRLVNEVLGMEKTVEVSIQENRSVTVEDIRLEIRR